jgi:hypothetical protein
MCQLLMAWPSQIMLDLLPPTVVVLIGKSSKTRLFIRVLTPPPPLPVPYASSYVILLLPQPSDFSPPSDLSSPNTPVSVFHLTDYISVRPSKRVIMHPGPLIDSNILPERFK